MTAIPPSKLTIKLSKHWCIECSIWAMFFSSSFMVSMIALFLNSTLSTTLIKAPFILFFNFVMRRNSHLFLKFYESIVWNQLRRRDAADVFIPWFKIEMLYMLVARRMKKDDNHHKFSLRHRGITMIFSLFIDSSVYFTINKSKNLQNSSAIQKNL